MLDLDLLQDLHRRNEDTPVLTVYLDADQRDFGERQRWRLALANGLRSAADRIDADEQEAFEAARARLEPALRPDANDFLPGRGWVGFASADRLLHAEDIPVPMPDLVRWERGPRVAPYVRALKQSRPILGVIVNSRHARLFRYRGGTLDLFDRLHGDTYLGDLTDVNVSKRAAQTTGVRGKTGTDAAQTFLRVERDRLLSRLVDEIREAIPTAGPIVLGGTAKPLAALRRLLEDTGGLAAERLVEHTDLSFDRSDAEIQAALEEAASRWSDRQHIDLVGRIVQQARSGELGTLGERDTDRALRERRVQLLAFAADYRAERPDRVDGFVAAAFAQNADLEEVSRAAGDQLLRDGDGIGALLRFRTDADHPEAGER